MRPLRAVLFDIDGTLLDTKDKWVGAFNATLAALGRSLMPPADVVRWIGTPFDVLMTRVCGLSLDEASRAEAEFTRREREMLRDGVKTFPGIREILPDLGPWRLAAVSNKHSDAARDALRIAGLLDAFGAVVGGDLAGRKKPDPEPVLRAAVLLGVRPDACALVGDTENDVRAGHAAGARTIGATWGYGGRASLESAGVDYLIETPAALPPLLRALTPNTAT